VLIPIAAVGTVVAIVTGAYVLVSAAGSSGRSAQAATTSSVARHAIALLEQERQQMIVMAAASRSSRVLSAPKLANTAAPSSSASPGSGTVPSLGPVNPGTARSDAYNMLSSFGWSPSKYFGCLDNLWSRESGWRWNAQNASGAYGIPQALPGSKMASAGSDWQTNPATQVRWGLGYIKGRYGNPCGAWSYWQANGYY
jgi:hypothetical protein